MTRFEAVQVASYIEGWGPPPGGDSAGLDVDIQGFDASSLDKFSLGRIGRICDFTLAGQKWQEQRAAKGKAKGKGKGKDGKGGPAPLPAPGKDEEGFALVDSRPIPQKGGKGGGKKGKSK